MPHSRRAAQQSLSRAFCPATSRPPSVVTSVRFSGTRQHVLRPHLARDGDHFVGGRHLEVHARLQRGPKAVHVVVLDVAAVLAQVQRDAVRAGLLGDERRIAADPGYGARRACRSVATWSMLTPSLIGWVSCKGSTSVRLACMRAHFASHLACPQWPAVEQPVERRPQQPAGIRQAARVVELLARKREQRRAAKYQGSLRHSIDRLRAALDAVTVAARRLERLAARGLVLEVETPAEFVEQPLLEQAQRPRRDRGRARRGARSGSRRRRTARDAGRSVAAASAAARSRRTRSSGDRRPAWPAAERVRPTSGARLRRGRSRKPATP